MIREDPETLALIRALPSPRRDKYESDRVGLLPHAWPTIDEVVGVTARAWPIHGKILVSVLRSPVYIPSRADRRMKSCYARNREALKRTCHPGGVWHEI